MMVKLGRVTASDVEGAVDAVYTKHPHAKEIRIKPVGYCTDRCWFEYTAILPEVTQSELQRVSGT